jgi:hypothetical protein
LWFGGLCNKFVAIFGEKETLVLFLPPLKPGKTGFEGCPFCDGKSGKVEAGRMRGKSPKKTRFLQKN